MLSVSNVSAQQMFVCAFFLLSISVGPERWAGTTMVRHAMRWKIEINVFQSSDSDSDRGHTTVTSREPKKTNVFVCESLAFFKSYLFILIYIQYEWIERSTVTTSAEKYNLIEILTHHISKKLVCMCGRCWLTVVVDVFFRFVLFCFILSLFRILFRCTRFNVTATCSDDRADFRAHLCISFSIKCCNATFFIHSVNITTHCVRVCVRAHIYDRLYVLYRHIHTQSGRETL